MIGTIISHYKILEKLGEGGMGVVYKAQDTKLDRLVALKFLAPHLSPSGQDMARFTQEAKAAATLNHPAICTIYSVEEGGDRQCIVMEYVEGQSLRTMKKPLPLDQVASIVHQLAEGLHVAHTKGVIHRDIKSDNIMITTDGRVKIMDFGLAKLKGRVMLTKAGTTVGTLAYMAPEQIQGEEVGPSCDLWSLGIITYELLTGQLPFRGEFEAAMMYAILNEEPPAVQSFRPDVPSSLKDLLGKLLQKDPARRIATAKDVIERMKKTPAESAHAKSDKSIAVLYFDNMSSEKESDYFCAGMTEDIITDLSKIKGLKVASRSDVLPFRQKEVNTREVGELLRVHYVLEGSVRKGGNRIRINAQLIDVGSGFHVWADRFDRLVEDIFDLQMEVSEKIAQALKGSLTETEKESLAQKPTDDLRAYDFYMRGRDLVNRRGKKNTELAVQMFQSALALDPNFSVACAALGETYVYMFEYFDNDPQRLTQAIEMNERALRLDPGSIDGQFGIAMVYLMQQRFAEARERLEAIVQQRPDFYDAHLRLGIVHYLQGDLDTAIRHYQRAAELKPYSEEPWMHLDMTYRKKGEGQKYEEAARKLLEVAEKKVQVDPDDVVTLSRLPSHYFHFGQKEKAFATLRRVVELAPDDGLAQYNCACNYALVGEKRTALDCLKRAFQSGFKGAPGWAKKDPDLDSLRDDPEFKALIAQYG